MIALRDKALTIGRLFGNVWARRCATKVDPDLIKGQEEDGTPAVGKIVAQSSSSQVSSVLYFLMITVVTF